MAGEAKSVAKVPMVRDERSALGKMIGLDITTLGRFEIGNSIVEREVRPLALARENSSFTDAGHRGVLASPIETARFNSIDPQAYLTDVITRIVGEHARLQIGGLMPWVLSTNRQRGLRTPQQVQRPRIRDCSDQVAGSDRLGLHPVETKLDET